jgi:hypothetical protein
MDQQATRGITTQQQRQQDPRMDGRRLAVTTAILAEFCAGVVAMPIPEGMMIAGE